MRCSRTCAAFTAAILSMMLVDDLAAQKIKREEFRRSVKLTILVDKVMQPTANWVTEEWMVKATAEAGFNVFSPRCGHEKSDELQQVTQWCEKYGIYHMPWMRGSLTPPKGAEADGKRLVWANGAEQELWSPNSDEFWAWTNRYIIEYARMSAANKHIMGVFLDYENYAPGKQGNLYYLSYDDIIMGKFAKAKGMTPPKLAPDKRKAWLDEQGRHEAFSAFQINHWRERCRALRKAVDEHDPTFQFCIYPAPGTPFMVEAIYPEWATKAAPLILADACTYGRPSRFLPEAASVEANRKRLLQGTEVPKQAGIPYIYTGGIDPAVKGADPEFSGKNAVMISEATDGYWIFYEGPKYDRDHPDYWKWFTWANRAIAERNFKAQHEPRQTPEDWTLTIFKDMGAGPKLSAPAATGETVNYPIVKLRGENILLVAAKAGMPVEVVLRNQPVAHYESLLIWDVRNSQMAKMSSGTIPNDKEGLVKFTPETDGLYLLAASAGSCAYSLVRSNAPIGLYAADGLSLIHGAERLYFHVPENVKQFAVSARGADGESVRVNVLDPDGKQAATGQTSPAEAKTTIRIESGTHAGKVWSLQVTRADEGILEDNAIALGPEVPQVLSLDPKQVFLMKEAK